MTIYDSIFTNFQTPMAIIAGKEKEMRFIRTNHAFEKLVGYPEEELLAISPSVLFPSCKTHIGSHQVRSASFALPLKINQSLYISLSWEQIVNTDEATCLLIGEDITAKTWIQRVSKTRPPLLSGIVSNNYSIERCVQNDSAPLFDSQLEVENHSCLDYLYEEDQARLIRLLEQAARRKQTDHFIVFTKKMTNMTQLELHITFCPFFYGDGSLKNYGFIVTDIHAVAEKIEPSVSLKILMVRKPITAQQLSEATGISLQTISKLRNNKITKPQRLTAELIANELHVSPQDIWPLLK